MRAHVALVHFLFGTWHNLFCCALFCCQGVIFCCWKPNGALDPFEITWCQKKQQTTTTNAERGKGEIPFQLFEHPKLATTNHLISFHLPGSKQPTVESAHSPSCLLQFNVSAHVSECECVCVNVCECVCECVFVCLCKPVLEVDFIFSSRPHHHHSHHHHACHQSQHSSSRT